MYPTWRLDIDLDRSFYTASRDRDLNDPGRDVLLGQIRPGQKIAFFLLEKRRDPVNKLLQFSKPGFFADERAQERLQRLFRNAGAPGVNPCWSWRSWPESGAGDA